MKRLNNLRILIVIVILTYNAKKNYAARSRIMNGRTARPRKGFFVLFLTEEAYSHGSLQTRELCQKKVLRSSG